MTKHRKTCLILGIILCVILLILLQIFSDGIGILISPAIYGWSNLTEPNSSDQKLTATIKQALSLTDSPTYVVVFGYPRTGSSFAGELFNQNPEAFYLYEPLHDLHRILPHPRPLDNSIYNQNVSDIWENVLTCNFHRTSKELMVDRVLYRHSNSFMSHYHCLRSSNPLHTCVSRLEDLCRSKPMRVFKTVRSTMESVKLLRDETIDRTKLRIIHLLRDPRGQINSVFTHKEHQKSGLDVLNLENTCKRLEKDVELQREMRNLYPQNFLEIFYEDLAHWPSETADKIYRFIYDSPAPSEVKEWLNQSTNKAELTKETFFGMERRNSTETANAWKQELPQSLIKVIDQKCMKFYELSRYYKPFDINEVK